MLGARRENKLGFTFGRYGDSPERVGIPAKQFVVIGDSERELQAFMTPYELDNNDVTIVLDDTLCKGVESWAWHGLQPINELTKPGGTLLILSRMSADNLLRFIPAKKAEYNLVVLNGAAISSTLWKYSDDTDARVLGALARIAPQIVSLDSLEQVISQEWKEEAKVSLARQTFDEVQTRPVLPDEGVKQVSTKAELPAWHQMREALAIPAIPSREQVTEGPYQAQRNPNYRTLSMRTNRPLMDFDRCRRCGLCWLQCPDSCFDIMSDGLYDINLEYCNGCGICADICPVAGCITMIPESMLADAVSQWETWQKYKKAYQQMVKDMAEKSPIQ
jgi:pyruvate ferredoxin oxidoreductase delta subunit